MGCGSCGHRYTRRAPLPTVGGGARFRSSAIRRNVMPVPVVQAQPKEADVVPDVRPTDLDPSTGQSRATIMNGSIPGPTIDNPVQQPATFVERPGEEATDSAKEESVEAK